MSRIVEELERQGIEVTYENIAIFALFVSDEGLIDKLALDVECDEKVALPNRNFSITESTDIEGETDVYLM